MIQSLLLDNFQSHEHTELEFGDAKFICLTGKSSSGKSAVVRAIRMLASNRRGSDFVTRGKTTSTVAAVLSDGTRVELKRSVKPDAALNQYDVAGEVYQKLGGAVPDAVSSALQMPAADQLQFAGQFDKPFLLDASAGEAARALGALTGIDQALSAVREGNRQRLQASAALKAKREELAKIEALEPEFEALDDEKARLASAAEILSHAYELSKRSQAIDTAIASVETAKRQLDSLKNRQPVVQISTAHAAELLEAAKHVAAVVQAAEQAAALYKQAKTARSLAAEDLAAKRQMLSDLRHELGSDLSSYLRASAINWPEQSGDFIEVETAAGLASEWFEARV